MKHRYAAGFGEGLFHGFDNRGVLGILIDVFRKIFLQGLSGDRHDGGIQNVPQMLRDSGDSAGPEERLHLRLGGGVDLGNLGRGFAQLLKLLHHVHVQLRLVGDGRQVQHGVGGAAGGHGHLNAVADSRGGQNLAGGDALFAQVHDGPARLEGAAQTGGIGGGNQGAAGQGHAQRLGHAAHGVGCAVERARTAARAGGVLQRGILALGKLVGLHHTQCLGNRGQVGFTSVKLNAAQHGAAHADDAGNIQPGGSHQHGGYDFIAGGQQHQPVQPVGLGHNLHGVADNLPGGQNIVHPLVALRHAVTGGDGPKLHGSAPACVNAVLGIFRNLVQIVMSGHHGVPCVGDSDQRLPLLQFAVRIPHGLKQGPRKGAVLLTQNCLTAKFHKKFPP
ncbi:hypothetical protein SDC9_88464 [bioreactor metagenome]|uniref:Uncharacterized protein n=1 Tax=bioreactor metagenome TaxID=1076179 RepID=A0A644ZLN9_9ZZZZ